MTLVNLLLTTVISVVLTFMVVAAFVIGYNAGVRWGSKLVVKSAMKIGYAEPTEDDWRWRTPDEIIAHRKP